MVSVGSPIPAIHDWTALAAASFPRMLLGFVLNAVW